MRSVAFRALSARTVIFTKHVVFWLKVRHSLTEQLCTHSRTIRALISVSLTETFGTVDFVSGELRHFILKQIYIRLSPLVPLSLTLART